MLVKIFGQKRSGTNLLAFLLKQFPEVELHRGEKNGGKLWKHGFPEACAERHCCIFKNPFAWYASNRDFVCPWDCEDWGIDGYVERANATLRWAAGRNDALIVRYEDYIANPVGVCRQLAGHLGAAIPESLRAPAQALNMEEGETAVAFDPSYYLEKRYLEKLSSQERNRIRVTARGPIRDLYAEMPEWTQAAPLEAVVILGPEGGGTQILQAIFAANGYGVCPGDEELDRLQQTGKPFHWPWPALGSVVVSCTSPLPNRRWPDLPQIIRNLRERQYHVRVFVVFHEWPSVRKFLRHHRHDSTHDQMRRRWHHLMRSIAAHSPGDLEFYMVNFESLARGGLAYLNEVAPMELAHWPPELSKRSAQ
jgi:hypothetical protein